MKTFKKVYAFAFLILFGYIIIKVFFSEETIRYKYGFINKKGEKVIPAIFYSATDFNNGLSAVSIKGKYGYINKHGKIIVDIKYNKTFPFSDGLGLIKDKINDKTIYTFIDKNGKTVLKLDKYIKVKPFSNGMSAVATEHASLLGNDIEEVSTTYGFINKKGKIIIPPNKNYLNTTDFVNDVCIINLSDKNNYRLINKNGEIIVDFYSNCKPLINNGRIKISDKNNRVGYLNYSGKLVIPYVFADGKKFSEGYAPVLIDKYFVENFLLDKNGNLISDRFGNNFIDYFSELTENQKVYVYINKQGKFDIGVFNKASNFSEGLAAVRINNDIGYINTSGNFVIEPKYYWAGEFKQGLAVVNYNDSVGVIDKNGNEIIKPKFLNLNNFSEGLAVFKNNAQKTNVKDLLFGLIKWTVIILFFIIGFIVMFVYELKNKKRTKQSIGQIVQKYNWDFYRTDNIDYKPLQDFVLKFKNDFKIKKFTEIKYSEIILGKYNNLEFRFLNYYYHSRTVNQKRTNNNFIYSVFYTKRKTKGDKLDLIYRNNTAKLLKLDKIGQLLNIPLFTVDDYDWLMVSDTDVFKNLKLSNLQISAFKENLKLFYKIRFTEESIIYVINNKFIIPDAKKITDTLNLIIEIDKQINL